MVNPVFKTNEGPDPDCPKCKGKGHWQYDHNHSTICAACCPHDQGRWQLLEHYGENNGKWCCKRGCGTTWDEELEMTDLLKLTEREKGDDI